MSFFYNLNKTLASIAGKDKVTTQATESVQPSELKTILESSYSAVHNKTEEGNEFSGKLAKAKATHQDSFDVDGKTYPVKEEHGMSAKEKSFAALAEPKDKITFADKIAGAKKEVDEMLGDVAADAMKSAIGKIREIETRRCRRRLGRHETRCQKTHGRHEQNETRRQDGRSQTRH
jgi:hypothetical protein